MLAAVRAIELRAGQLRTDVLSGGFRSAFRGAGVEVGEVREYAEGDDPRSVDWNVTARLGRPFVKRFVEERERTLVFVLDLGAGMAAGVGAWSLRQAAARLCACLGRLAIDNHDRVGLLAGAQPAGVTRFVLPDRGPGHVLRILRDVVELPTLPGGSALDALLARAAGRLRRGAVLFVLSDFAGVAPLAALAPCARRHDVVVVPLLAAELSAPPAAMVRGVDPVSGAQATFDFTADRVRAAWLQQVATWWAERHGQFERAGCDVLPLRLPGQADLEAIAAPLRRFFHRRAMRPGRRG